ncbi:MAG: energy transducer TonB [Elusimicrobiota bacterium]
MERMRFFLNSLAAGTVLSVFIHAGIGGLSYYLLIKDEPLPIVAELDFFIAPALPASAGGRPSKPAAAWTIPQKANQSPPQPAPENIPELEQIPSRATGLLEGEGGNGEGEGEYSPASQAARKPHWIGNFITPGDYPLAARQEGKEGRVVIVVRLDAEGRVYSAKILQGRCPALNAAALRKVKNAVFTPAYDGKGRPVACEVTLPIRFQLKSGTKSKCQAIDSY